MDINDQADILVQKIKHYIITSSGRTSEAASIEEFHQALCTSLREEIMINWTATFDTFEKKKPRHINYLSLEYLPGRLLGTSVTNLRAQELVQAVLAKMGRSFSDLINCEPDVGLGNGGLGRLASCFLDSLATLHYPARAYGLRYQYGIFEQEIWDGIQIERPDAWLLNEDPWELRRDPYSVSVHFNGRAVHAKNTHGDDVYLLEDFEEVRALPYDLPIIGYSENSPFSVLTLRLWSTKESPRNFQLQRFNAGFLGQAAENTSLTDVLYPNDQTELGKRSRLKQEFLLVNASLQDIIRRHLKIFGDLSLFNDKVRIQINDTHPALVIAELVRLLTKSHDFSWEKAWEVTQECCSYTNHTILSEALEEWNEGRVHELLPRQYLIIQRLNLEMCQKVREKFPGNEEKVRRMSMIENGQIRMAHLAIYGSHKVNGVSKIHSQILKTRIFRDFSDLFPDKFVNVTNGVTQRQWLLHCNPKLAAFITERIGNSWICNFREISALADYASDPKSQQEFLEIKKQNKQACIEFLAKENIVRDEKGKIISHSLPLPPTALFDVQIKRIHEYKRQTLNALHLIMLYEELLENPASTRVPRLVIIGGKAAPGYERAKQIIQLICCIGRKVNNDRAMQGWLRVAFIENYNVSKAEILIPSADLSEQLSTAGWEASGTGNMKLTINGALTIGTEDGANIEMRQAITDKWWPFRFGASAEQILNMQINQSYEPQKIYEKSEKVKKAIDRLVDNTFAENDEEHAAFSQIHDSLIGSRFSDPFFVLQDLVEYYEVQKKVESLFQNPSLWAETAIHNIAAMGSFSTDVSIQNYAETIWNLVPCPPDSEIITKVQAEYSEHDRCRIVPHGSH